LEFSLKREPLQSTHFEKAEIEIMKLWQAIESWAQKTPDKTAIAVFKGPAISYSALRRLIIGVFNNLPEVRGKKVGLFIGDRPSWVVYDIALTLKGAVIVPLPYFFSQEQLGHILNDTALDLVVTDKSDVLAYNKIEGLLDKAQVLVSDELQHYGAVEENPEPRERLSGEGIVKITYTSGTTGSPRGVKISLGNIEAVVDSLIKRADAGEADEYLSILPLSTLLENIGGVYVPLTVGAGITFLDTKNIGHEGGIAPAPELLFEALASVRPSGMIIVPLLIEPLLHYAAKSGASSHFRFIACGGAPIPDVLLEESRAVNLPIFEGYGLSECASVVALNGMDSHRPGSVGRPLDHVKLKIEDNEVVVCGRGVMGGYLNDGGKVLESWHTGDLGYIDDDGYLYITGRKDSMFSTSLGRTISPEWIEKRVSVCAAISKIMAWGEKKPFVSAIVVPETEWLKITAEGLGIKINKDGVVNDPRLKEAMLREIRGEIDDMPEYAKIKDIIITTLPFRSSESMMTPNGRLRRGEIYRRYKQEIDGLYNGR